MAPRNLFGLTESPLSAFITEENFHHKVQRGSGQVETQFIKKKSILKDPKGTICAQGSLYLAVSRERSLQGQYSSQWRKSASNGFTDDHNTHNLPGFQRTHEQWPSLARDCEV